MLAWLLTWGRTYVMAWVSERIAADLRNQTYGHMQSAVAGVLRRQTDRRPDLARQHRHRSDLLLSVGLRARLCQRHSDAGVDGGDPLVARLAVRPGNASSLAGDRIPGASSAQPIAARFCLGHAGMGRDDQRAGRHDSRHSRGQGVCPGAAGSRAVSHGKRSRVSGQLPRERLVVVLRAGRQPADRAGIGRGVGLSARGGCFNTI